MHGVQGSELSVFKQLVYTVTTLLQSISVLRHQQVNKSTVPLRCSICLLVTPVKKRVVLPKATGIWVTKVLLNFSLNRKIHYPFHKRLFNKQLNPNKHPNASRSISLYDYVLFYIWAFHIFSFYSDRPANFFFCTFLY